MAVNNTVFERSIVQQGGMPAVIKALFEVTSKQIKCREKIDWHRSQIKLQEANIVKNNIYQKFLLNEKKRLDEEKGALLSDTNEISLDAPTTPTPLESPSDESCTNLLETTAKIEQDTPESQIFMQVQRVSPALWNPTLTPNTDPFLPSVSTSPAKIMNPNQPLRFSSSQANSERVATLSPQSLFFANTRGVSQSFKNSPCKQDFPLDTISEVPVPAQQQPLAMPALERETQECTQLGLCNKKGTKKRKLDDN